MALHDLAYLLRDLPALAALERRGDEEPEQLPEERALHERTVDLGGLVREHAQDEGRTREHLVVLQPDDHRIAQVRLE